ncbi:MAG: hypothetical protein AB1806_00770 [Acidobacteriota bacterium]
MKSRGWIWVIAVAVTLGSAVWQRMTGPTYPARGTLVIGGAEFPLRLTRTHGGPGDQAIVLIIPDHRVTGEVAWRRYPTADPWTTVPLRRNFDRLEAALPHQPVAAKLEYQARFHRGTEEAVFPERPAVTRFRNDVPAGVLIPHVAAMFLAMLFSTLAGLSALGRFPQVRRDACSCGAFLGVGGFILGPLMQEIAFGAWWTGIPFGWDLTDNKTLFAAIAWAYALWAMRRGRVARGAIITAAVVTLVIFVIPHSTWGSELDWAALPGQGM